MGVQAPEGLLAIHTNMPATVPADVDRASLAGDPPPAHLSAEERRAYGQLIRTYGQVEYARMMAARPQTLYRTADWPWWASPPGFSITTTPTASRQQRWLLLSIARRATTGEADTRRGTRQHHALLADEHRVSPCRLYWEYKGGFFNVKGVSIPVAVTVFPGEQYQAPRSWAEQAYPNLIYFNEVEKGGHFAAWEQPQLFTEELRAAFRSLR